MKSVMKILCASLVVVALPLTAAQAQNMSKQDRQKMVENIVQADANDDGAISRSEFETLIKLNASDGLGRAAQVKKSGRYSAVFKRLDANGDGFLTQQEMQRMAEQARG